MSEIEVRPPVFTADYSGEPGRRAFFIQARSADELYTFALEKQQVQLLAEKLSELLLLVDADDAVASGVPSRDDTLQALPDSPRWRVGSIALAYQEDTELVVVVVAPFEPESVEGEDAAPPDEEQDSIRLVLTRDQVRAFVLHALGVVAEGRPLCQLCGLPMDPDGHACPASNGHRPHD